MKKSSSKWHNFCLTGRIKCMETHALQNGIKTTYSEGERKHCPIPHPNGMKKFCSPYPLNYEKQQHSYGRLFHHNNIKEPLSSGFRTQRIITSIPQWTLHRKYTRIPPWDRCLQGFGHGPSFQCRVPLLSCESRRPCVVQKRQKRALGPPWCQRPPAHRAWSNLAVRCHRWGKSPRGQLAQPFHSLQHYSLKICAAS